MFGWPHFVQKIVSLCGGGSGGEAGGEATGRAAGATGGRMGALVDSLQVGQRTARPAWDESTRRRWLQCGHTNLMSILCLPLPRMKHAPSIRILQTARLDVSHSSVNHPSWALQPSRSPMPAIRIIAR